MIVIDSGYFNAGVVLDDGVVTRAAPIVKYMIGWTRARVMVYANKKGWSAVELTTP